MDKQSALNRLNAIENEAQELRKLINQSEPCKPTKEQRFLELINGLTIKIDKENYPNSTFYFKEGRCFLEIENHNLRCSRDNVWSIFEKEYSMGYVDIQAFIKKRVEEHFKCRELTHSTAHDTAHNGM